MFNRRPRPKAEPATVTREITISNELGLHARPAAAFAKCAKQFRSDIVLIKDDDRFSATSLIEILRANLNQGEVAILEAHGPDADSAIEALEKLVNDFCD